MKAKERLKRDVKVEGVVSRFLKIMDKMEDWATIALVMLITLIAVIIEIIVLIGISFWFIGYFIIESIKQKITKINKGK